MKHLTLLRHAKSSWKDPRLADFDRPLNRRGRSNAPLMGQRLAARGVKPDLIMASPALRARLTAELVAVELGCDIDKILWQPRIYDADLGTLMALVREFQEVWQDVLLVGHNPGLTELANHLARCRIDNIVTCGALRLECPVDGWRQLGRSSAKLLFYDSPREGLLVP